MRKNFRDQSGFALIPVLALMIAMFGLSLGLIAEVEGQQRQSSYERIRESSFNLAEAALGAETVALGRSWPSGSSSPTTCNPSSTSSSCPQNSSVSGGYTTPDYTQVCASSSSTPAWQTTVRDNVSGEQYWTPAVDSRGQYDGASFSDGTVWVRATAFVRCNKTSIVALVSRSVISMDFPSNVITANWFATSNQGKKVIVDTLGAYAEPPSIRPGPASQPSPLVVRCAGLTPAQCLSYDASKGQVQPPTARTDPTISSSTLSASQLQTLEQQASAAGTLWTTGNCPSAGSSLSSVNGAPVVIQGPCDVSINLNTIVNSATSPGALIIENGTLSVGGNAVVYGLVYAVNRQNSTGSVITVSGNGTIQGVIAIDGPGGITAGSSKTNVIYDPRAATLLKGSSGAAVNKNFFRLLPQNTP